jgi:hypothetical protein
VDHNHGGHLPVDVRIKILGHFERF